MESIVSAIETIGFPIVMTVLFWRYIKIANEREAQRYDKLIKRFSNTDKKFFESINKITAAFHQGLDDMDKRALARREERNRSHQIIIKLLEEVKELINERKR